MNQVRTIFIAEDDLYIQDLYIEILTASGYHVVDIASNGVEALQKYQKMDPKPDLVLLDHRMPLKNGLQVLKEMLMINCGCKAIFVTADRSITEEAKKIGATEVILKPFRMVELIEVIVKI
ncbi:MAG: response regulator [Candidatus Odinarchaeota archaeon]